MICRSLLKIRLLIASLLLWLALTDPIAALQGDENEPDQLGFAIGGIALGMDFESVLKIFPTATAERAVANCYDYGRAVSVPARTRRTLLHRDNAGTLTLSFEPPNAGGRLSRIHLDRPVYPSTGGIQKLLDRLLARYGPYDQILHRRKMEPAGRIVGFEWYNVDGATLRAVLRNIYDNGSHGIHLSILARSNVQASPPNRRAQWLACGKP